MSNVVAAETIEAGLTVSIAPDAGVLSVMRHLNYKPWYALAEYVDNSIQSFLSSEEKLIEVEKGEFQLQVHVDVKTEGEHSYITISDNAAGISDTELDRAFRPAAAPSDRSGLCEFGMGMKSASAWFSPKWIVRTKALGEAHEKEIIFDINKIVETGAERLDVKTYPAETPEHYTVVRLENLHHRPIGRTVSKIKEHLASIYRVYIREGTLVLYYNGELLSYETPKVLVAPNVSQTPGDNLEWKKDINFDFGDGLKVEGFAMLMNPGSFSRSGFALFRRKRLIEGSGDEGYRPYEIFRQSSSHRFLRLYGELHIEGFEVSHTKDGFKWAESEDVFLELLEEYLNSDELPLLSQADKFRVKPTKERLEKAAQKAVKSVSDDAEKKLPEAIAVIADLPPVTTPETLPEVESLVKRVFSFDFRGMDWEVTVLLADSSDSIHWMEVGSMDDTERGLRKLVVKMSLGHPFMIRFAGEDSQHIESQLRIGIALAISEVLARGSGVRRAGTISRNLNELLFDVLSSY